MAIEQLQSELTASRKEEALTRQEAQRVRPCAAAAEEHELQLAARTLTLHVLPPSQVCDDQAAELRRAEEQLAAVQSALAARASQVGDVTRRARRRVCCSCCWHECVRSPACDAVHHVR